MEVTWRTLLKKYIEEHYVQQPEEWYDLTISTGGVLNLTIITRCFEGVSFQQRREKIDTLLRKFQIPLSPGFLSLYSVEEAKSLDLSRPKAPSEVPIYSWHDLALWAANAEEPPKGLRREPRVPRTIAFYSFKGGVGRTTALIHVAWILATRGRKVVAVDLDLEAPGLSTAMHLESPPKHGIVDYFYERSYLPKSTEPDISIGKIFGEVRIQDAGGRLFVVPVGSMSLDYIAKIDDLRANAITEQGEDLWSTFLREISEHLQPDIILIDARTGINEWGAFSLLRAADEAFIFIYPNEQNIQGLSLLLKVLGNLGTPSLHFVFSPVPSVSEAGMDKVRAQWESMRNQADNEADQVDSSIDESQETAEPLVIFYNPLIALADDYPVPELMSYYNRIANIVDEDTTTMRLSMVLTTGDRWKIIESLKFPEVDARNPKHDLRGLFQRTADFDRFLDETTCLIRGRKGTGKSALYWLLLEHNRTARELARGRLDQITCLSGHGKFHVRPTRDEFQEIDRRLQHDGGSWEAVWRSYLLLRMHLNGCLNRNLPRRAKFEHLRDLLGRVPYRGDHWKVEHTRTLIAMAAEPELKLLEKDMLDVIDEQLRKRNESLWLLYDDLDEDLPQKGGVRQRALAGLFQLVQDSDARRLTAIRYKVFLREDIWDGLVFDNKSHFNGRDLLLRWTRVDFLRLALRQTYQSKEFKDLVDRFAPIESIDQADEETIDRTLQLLWGKLRERGRRSKYVSRWVYDRLTDSSGTTFPRSLNILLRTARDHEVTYKGQQHVPPPTDRLLRAQSLNQGLVVASRQRCQEIREEYPEMGRLFDYLGNIPALVSETELRQAWQTTVQDSLPTFEEFIEVLQTIGLASWRESEQRFRFADIYIHGFSMPRGGLKF